MDFHCVPNHVLYQAEPLPDIRKTDGRGMEPALSIIASHCVAPAGRASSAEILSYRMSVSQPG